MVRAVQGCGIVALLGDPVVLLAVAVLPPDTSPFLSAIGTVLNPLVLFASAIDPCHALGVVSAVAGHIGIVLVWCAYVPLGVVVALPVRAVLHPGAVQSVVASVEPNVIEAVAVLVLIDALLLLSAIAVVAVANIRPGVKIACAVVES